MKKMNIIRRINAAFWIIAGISCMVIAGYCSIYPYTLLSFFGSLIFHGGFCFLLGFAIDEVIINYFKK